MARPRIHATELSRLLNAVDQPVYVLDDEFMLIFMNRACVDWLGSAANGLLGCRAAYHSLPEATGTQRVAASLCPPPAVMAGREISADLSRTAADGRLLRRRARFIPLSSGPDDVFGVIAIGQGDDLPEPAAEPPQPLHEPPPTELHAQIARFRSEAAGRHRVDRLLGNGPAMCRARRQLELAAGSRASVLLVGPAGSGRQHTAAAIHYAANAPSAGALIPIACSLLGTELIHSTVTTLATGTALGEESARSTLLLNQADQLPADAQAEVAALVVDRPFPLRLIATVEQPLFDLASQGKYRDDLAAALSTITIELPPLAQRREDVPLLAQLFLEEANARTTRQIGGFAPETLDALHAYSWPGNVDELAEVVAEAHRRAGNTRIEAADLPERIHLAADAAARPPQREETIVLDEFLGRLERELIRRALAQAKGNKAKAARLLGMTRPRLYRRLVQLELEE